VPDPVTGKRRQRSKGGYRTKKACQAALNDALAALRTGAFVETSKRTLASYLVDEWLPAMQPPRVRPSTWLSYQRSLERHVIPGPRRDRAATADTGRPNTPTGDRDLHGCWAACRR
jgi:Phage integrase, N-terminal SAM-like domain/Arm DNA-binding domain